MFTEEGAVCGVLGTRALTTGVRLVIMRTPHITDRYRPKRFVVIGLSRGNREVPLAVYSCSHRRNAIAVMFRRVNMSAVGVTRLGTKSTFHSFIKPLKYPSRFIKRSVRRLGGGGVMFITNNINATPICPRMG